MLTSCLERVNLCAISDLGWTGNDNIDLGILWSFCPCHLPADSCIAASINPWTLDISRPQIYGRHRGRRDMVIFEGM